MKLKGPRKLPLHLPIRGAEENDPGSWNKLAGPLLPEVGCFLQASYKLLPHWGGEAGRCVMRGWACTLVAASEMGK